MTTKAKMKDLPNDDLLRLYIEDYEEKSLSSEWPPVVRGHYRLLSDWLKELQRCRGDVHVDT